MRGGCVDAPRGSSGRVEISGCLLFHRHYIAMVHVLGINLHDSLRMRVSLRDCLTQGRMFTLLQHALTKIFGVGYHVSHRLCARFQIHDRMRVKELSPYQLTALTSFLSSPATAQRLPPMPLADPEYVPPPASKPANQIQADFNAAQQAAQRQRDARMLRRRQRGFSVRPSATDARDSRDPLYSVKIESELKREIRENIAHQRMIGSYVGKRHAMHLPVRGQNTQSNAKTAKKLNHRM